MASWCVRAVRQSYSLVASPAFLRTSPRLLCTATQQKNGERSEEEADRPEQSAAEKVLEEKTQLEDKLKDMTEKYKRALADTENLRTRSQKMIEDAKLYGIQGFCKDLLEVADILEKATDSVPKEEVTSQNPHLKNLYDGLVMTEVQIQKTKNKQQEQLNSIRPVTSTQHTALALQTSLPFIKKAIKQKYCTFSQVAGLSYKSTVALKSRIYKNMPSLDFLLPHQKILRENKVGGKNNLNVKYSTAMNNAPRKFHLYQIENIKQGL